MRYVIYSILAKATDKIEKYVYYTVAKNIMSTFGMLRHLSQGYHYTIRNIFYNNEKTSSIISFEKLVLEMKLNF